MGNPAGVANALGEPIKIKRLPFSILSAKRLGAACMATGADCDVKCEVGNNSKLSLTGAYLTNND